MIVTCEADPDNKDILCVAADGEPVRTIHAGLFGKNPQFPATVETPEELYKILNALENKQAKKILIGKLAKKSMPSFELKHLLQKYLVSEEGIESLLAEFQSAGYIDDDAWVESLARSMSAQKKGPGAIERKLREKKAPQELIEKALALANDDEAQMDQIRRLIKTRYRARNLVDFREREKTVAALVRRGFDAGIVRDVISEFSKA